MTEEWVWISRWEDFQHYQPERDRAPAWIKDYTKQLSDYRYLALTDRQRALLSDLRRSFAVTSGWVPRSVAVISRHRHRQTFRSDLEALNHAGFIEFCSRESLENRLDQLYASRAPARSRRGFTKVNPKSGPRAAAREGARRSGLESDNSRPAVCPECGVGGGLHAADCSHAPAELGGGRDA
jgi:hypothetical protein